MYSPTIDPSLIKIIYQKAKESKVPMTKYVNSVLRAHLTEKVSDQKPATPETTKPTSPETKPKAV